MKLLKLLSGIETLMKSPNIYDIDVTDIKIDSRNVCKGDMFIALNGTKNNGIDFIDDAFLHGAAVIVGEEKCERENYIQVEDARKFYALVSKNFFEKCCDKMKIIGVTGTNGKTTTTNIIYQILQKTHKKVGLIGTFGAKWSEIDDFIVTNMTTPDPYELHKLFFKMYHAGCKIVVMEVSAHAIALRKICGINFEAGVLTNITEDHLDFFKSMTNYALVKIDFFESYSVRQKIICGDDKYCSGYIKNSKTELLKYGLGETNDITAMNIDKNLLFTSFVYRFQEYKFNVKMNLVGEYNILNALAAITVCLKLGVKIENIVSGLKSLKQIGGRFNVIAYGENRIIIDYAHSPDGLEKILMTVKNLSNKTLVVVFGCGGDRDKKKRPIMGEIASKIADEVILTSDNPRSEVPEEIINEIAAGIDRDVVKIADRKEAIEYVLAKFNEDENIVIAGKGAENYQEIKGQKIHFSDYEIVNNFIKNNKK